MYLSLLKIFFLHFQHVFQHRLRSLVWFFIPLMNNLTLILFWSGALAQTDPHPDWNTRSMTTYYFLLTIAGAMLSSHIEEDVAVFDIQYGDLTRYLTRPFPYYWIKFIEEIPYRILQGSYGILLLVAFSYFFRNVIQLTKDPITILYACIISIMAFFLAFTFKMNLGLSAFWFKDSRGFFELFTIILIIFSGGIIPLHLLPQNVQTIMYVLPFAYTAYFPVMAVQGNFSYVNLLQIIGMQTVWIIILIIINRILWKKGIYEFTAVGQ